MRSATYMKRRHSTILVKDTYNVSVQNIVGLDDGLGPAQRPAITQRNCVIYTLSDYKYTLISERTRLFGLLRILDNLISGAVCYFCTTISVFC